MKVVIFSGTTEGRELSRAVAALGIEATVCVATELGAEEQGRTPGITVCTGRLDADAMAALLQGAALCVDATHPYATEATRNICAAAAAVGVEYHRLLRPASNLPAGSMISKHEMKMALIASFFKVIVQPLIAFLIGKYLFRLDAWWLSAAVICSMLPTAVNHFIVSQKYHSCGNESRLIILFTTIGFCIMISCYLLIFGVIQ